MGRAQFVRASQSATGIWGTVNANFVRASQSAPTILLEQEEGTTTPAFGPPCVYHAVRAVWGCSPPVSSHSWVITLKPPTVYVQQQVKGCLNFIDVCRPSGYCCEVVHVRVGSTHRTCCSCGRYVTATRTGSLVNACLHGALRQPLAPGASIKHVGSLERHGLMW